jgi:hypothetical protein
VNSKPPDTTKSIQQRRYRRKCRNCGCDLPMHKLNFCSRKCAQRWQAKEYKRKHKVVVKRFCVVCKRELFGHQIKFCSNQCLHKFHNEARFEDKERDGVCCVCGKPFVIHRGSKTCSPVCSKVNNRNKSRELMNKKRKEEREEEVRLEEVALSEFKIRICLRCGKEFKSYGFRFCPKCTKINSCLTGGIDWQYGIKPEAYSM